MQPTTKSKSIEDFLEDEFGFDRREFILRGDCVPPPVGCGGVAVEENLREDGDRREYAISGLCQKCQDRVFDPD